MNLKWLTKWFPKRETWTYVGVAKGRVKWTDTGGSETHWYYLYASSKGNRRCKITTTDGWLAKPKDHRIYAEDVMPWLEGAQPSDYLASCFDPGVRIVHVSRSVPEGVR